MRMLSGVAAALVLTLAGCGGDKGYHPRASDFGLTLRVTSTECFGKGGGCNIGYKVVASGWHGPKGVKLDDDYDVTYTVTGAPDGPVTDTMTVYSDGRYAPAAPGLVTVPSRTTPLAVKVTAVSPTS